MKPRNIIKHTIFKQNDNIIQHDNSEKELIMMLIKENTEFKNMLMKVVENGTLHLTSHNTN